MHRYLTFPMQDSGQYFINTKELLLTVGKNHDRRPWPETRILIEMDSACRNQQGNCGEIKNSVRPFLLLFQHCG